MCPVVGPGVTAAAGRLAARQPRRYHRGGAVTDAGDHARDQPRHRAMRADLSGSRNPRPPAGPRPPRAETPAVAGALGRHRRLAFIRPPATIDGGDVLVVGRRVFVGRSLRTDDAGIEQLRAGLGPSGYDVLAR